MDADAGSLPAGPRARAARRRLPTISSSCAASSPSTTTSRGTRTGCLRASRASDGGSGRGTWSQPRSDPSRTRTWPGRSASATPSRPRCARTWASRGTRTRSRPQPRRRGDRRCGSASAARTGSPIHVDADGCPRRDRAHPRQRRSSPSSTGDGSDSAICHDPGCSVGVLRSIEEQERQVVLDGVVRQSGQGPGVPRASGGRSDDARARRSGPRAASRSICGGPWSPTGSRGSRPPSWTRSIDRSRSRFACPGGRAAPGPDLGPRRAPAGARVDVLGPRPGPEGRPRRARGRRPRPAARSGPLAVLSPRRGGPRPRVGDCRRRPDAPLPDGVRGRREDGLHHELRMERHRADGRRARDPSRRPRARRRRPAHERVPHARRDGRRSGVLLSRRGPRRLSRRLPDRARTRGGRRRARPRGLRDGDARGAARRSSSRPRCSRSPASARTPPRTS